MKIVTINDMWCPGCIIMHKVWESVSKKYPDIEFIKYDFDLDEDMVKPFNPGDVLPITIFMIEDKEVERLIGEKNEQDLIEVIERLK
jgi:thiol-disulfide isomerase/thioredoxin